jgi:hypothetical protein
MPHTAALSDTAALRQTAALQRTATLPHSFGAKLFLRKAGGTFSTEKVDIAKRYGILWDSTGFMYIGISSHYFNNFKTV